jgi:hypothetical protein
MSSRLRRLNHTWRDLRTTGLQGKSFTNTSMRNINEAAKANGKVKIGGKRKCTSPTGPNKHIRQSSDDEEELDWTSINGGSENDNGDSRDEWTGLTHEKSYSDEDMVFGGSDCSHEDGSERL